MFLGYVGYLYLQVGYRIPALGAIRFELLAGAVLGAFAVAVLARRDKFATSPALAWTFALIFIALLMVPASVAPAYSWDIFIDRVMKFAMMTVFIVAFASSPRALTWFIAVFMLVFLRMAYEGVLGLRDGSLIWENQGVLRLHGTTPIYMHPNSFGGTQLGVLTFCFYFFLATRNWRLRSMLVVQAVMSLVIVMYTGSRTTYVGLAGFVVYLVLAARARFKALLILTVVVVVVAPLVPDQYIERAETIATQQDKEGASISLRKEIWRDAWAIFTEHPLGVGVGAFPLARHARFGRVQDTHNLYLEVATNLGVFGLIIFVGFLSSLYISLRRQQLSFAAQLDRMRVLLGDGVLKRSPRRAQPPLPAKTKFHAQAQQHMQQLRFLFAMTQATVGFLVIRLVLGAFGHDFYEIYWWFMSGIALALANINLTTVKRTDALCATSAADAGASVGGAKTDASDANVAPVTSSKLAGA
jgi:O-antigen ligase